MIAQTIQKITKRAPAKVLIVDDEPQVRRALRTILTSQGCAVVEVRDGEEALEEIKADPPDLILLDINLPASTVLKPAERFETPRMSRSSW